MEQRGIGALIARALGCRVARLALVTALALLASTPSVAAALPPSAASGEGGGESISFPVTPDGRQAGPAVYTSATETHVTAVAARVATAAAAMASGCRYQDSWRYSRSLLGAIVYKFHHTTYWCWSTSGRLTNVTTGVYVSDVDSNWYYRGLTASSGYFYDSNGSHYGLRQGHFDNCVLKYGCIGSEYPWVKIWVHAGGSYEYATGT
jgi:hypothetical protein